MLKLVIQDFEHRSAENRLAVAEKICIKFQKLQHSNHLPQDHLKQEIAAQRTSLYLLYVKVTLKQQKVEQQHAPGRENGAILSSFQLSHMSDGYKIAGLQVEAHRELQFSQVLLLVTSFWHLQSSWKDFEIKGVTVALGLGDGWNILGLKLVFCRVVCSDLNTLSWPLH